jgi:hypothetical protein
MSTPAVNAAISAYIESQVSPLKVFDLDEYVSLSELPQSDQCLLLGFNFSTEQISTIGDTDSLGFAEQGSLQIHWLYPTGFDVAAIKAAADALRLSLRGRRIGDIIIEGVEPFKQSRSLVDDHSQWTAFVSILDYSLHSCG